MSAVPAVYEAREVTPLSADALHSHVQIIQRVMAEVMKMGVHYGVIEGTGGKPSLWRPGAEAIRLAFHCDVRQEIELEKDGEDYGYRVKSLLFNPIDGSTVEGWGECWTSEEKFAWRASLCEEEFEATDAAHKRVKFKKDRDGEVFTLQQIRQNPADQRNAVLKRACTRSFREVILRGTAASDIFDQQLEEDDEGAGEKKAESPKQAAKPGVMVAGVFKSGTPANEKGKKPGKVEIESGGSVYVLGFWKTPADLAMEPDWSKFAGRACRFSFEARESGGRVYKNLTYLTFPAPADEKQPEMFGDRMAEEEREAMRAGA